jgi:hypothetical protein
MKQISIKELNNIMCSTSITAGATITYGKYVYRITKFENGVAWIEYLPYDEYSSKRDEYDNTSVGWGALLRIA